MSSTKLTGSVFILINNVENTRSQTVCRIAELSA